MATHRKDKQKTTETQGNQGEGNKTADKSYREAATQYAHSHDTQREARAAEKDVEKSPGEYADAERKGKAKSAGEDEAEEVKPPASKGAQPERR